MIGHQRLVYCCALACVLALPASAAAFQCTRFEEQVDSPPGVGFDFAEKVDLAGDIALAGYYKDPNSIGSLYVYRRIGGDWSIDQRIVPAMLSMVRGLAERWPCRATGSPVQPRVSPSPGR